MRHLTRSYGKGSSLLVVENVPLVADGARDLGLKLSTQQLERFQRYMEVLIDWSERVSLTVQAFGRTWEVGRERVVWHVLVRSA